MDRKTLIELYFKFFEGKDHKKIQNFSLYPENDPSALFTSAGMHPIVPYLLGERHPLGTRLYNVQRCIRTGDIDEVGDTTHLTFFEMLGNWSLGDYGKKEAISWSFEFLTGKEWLNMDPNQIYITLYEGDEEIPRDEESKNIWMDLGVPEDHIFFLGREDNWWGPVGHVGPCGPDTEMFFDNGFDKCSENCKPGCSCGKYVEVWNDVFMFYDKQPDGTYNILEQQNIDTGMGVERMLQILNRKETIYDTHVFQPLFEKVKELVGKEDDLTDKDIKRIRIIVDHTRSAVFAMGDPKGIPPGKEEQGYVIRRLLRRAMVKLDQLDLELDIILELINPIIEEFGDHYPELIERRDFVYQQTEKEAKKFRNTIKRGMRKFNRMVDNNNGLSGEDAFMLFSTYGMPKEIIFELLAERNLPINKEEFYASFEEHKELSRTAAKGRFQSGLSDHSKTVKRYHTATHLLHQALRNVLGDTVHQTGSNITKERTRFDVTFKRKMTKEEVKQVEEIVNEQVEADLPVEKEIMPLEEAKKSNAIGLFDETYGDKVSIYSVGNFSKEFCAGPHVDHTGEIGKFRIKKQKKIGANVLRIYGVVEE